MVGSLLPIRSERDCICHLTCRSRMFLFHRINEAWCCRCLLMHHSRKCWSLITELTDSDWLCGKWSISRITYGNVFHIRSIIGNLNFISNQGWFRFVFPSPETDAGPFVRLTYFVMQEGFWYNKNIQIGKVTAVAIPFLEGSNPNFLDYRALAFVVSTDSFMGLLMVIRIEVHSPQPVQFFQIPNIFELCFTVKRVQDLIELFNLPFAFAASGFAWSIWIPSFSRDTFTCLVIDWELLSKCRSLEWSSAAEER